MWLLLRRDIVSRLGRFGLIACSCVILVWLFISDMENYWKYHTTERLWQAQYHDSSWIGKTTTPDAKQFTPTALIPAGTEQALMSLPGVDGTRSFSAVVLEAQARTTELNVTVVVTDPQGLAILGKLNRDEVRQSQERTIWLGNTIARRLQTDEGESIELWQKVWRVRLLGSLPHLGRLVMVRRADADALGVGNGSSFVVVAGHPNPAMLAQAAKGLTVMGPGVHSARLLNDNHELPLSDLLRILIDTATLWAAVWTAAAIPTWEQRGRAGLLRSLGGGWRHRIVPVLGSLLIQLTLTAVGTAVLKVVRNTVDSFGHTGVLAAAKPILLWFPLVLVAALILSAPHLRSLLSQPCVPKQAPVQGPGLPVVLILAMLSIMVVVVAGNAVTWLTDRGAERISLGDRLTVSGVTAGQDAFVDPDTVQRLMQLPSVAATASWTEIGTYESIGAFTLNLRGLDPDTYQGRVRGSLFHVPHGRSLADDEVIIGDQVARLLGAGVGERVKLIGHSWRVIDVLEPSRVHSNEVLFPQKSLALALGRADAPNLVRLAPRAGRTLADLESEIRQGWTGQLPLYTERSGPDSRGDQLMVNLVLGLSVLGIAAVASIFTFITIVYNARAEFYQRELGVLRAVGASHWRAARSMLREGVKLTLGSGLVATLIFWSIVFLQPGAVIGITDVLCFVVGLALSLVASIAGTGFSMVRTAKWSVGQLLRTD